MGYYTQFSLKVLENDEHPSLIEIFREENDHANWALEDSGDCRDSAKWYDCDKDMKTFSEKHPEALFELSGVGEESDDIWKQWWQNGKCQTTKGVIVFEEFDRNKME